MKFLIASLLFINLLFAQTLTLGDNYPSFELVDQFDKTTTIDANDKMIIMSFEKAVSSDLNERLKTKKSDYLATYNTKYVADISGMPSIIAKLFALPKMRKYNYSIYLIQDEEQSKVFPRKEEMLTLLKMKNNKIDSIEYMTPKEFIKLLDD
jgi:hypothetical protein